MSRASSTSVRASDRERAGAIDLHLHTTASDGRSSPGDLVHEARHAGLTLIAVTDHDTTAGLADAASAAKGRGIDTVPGIEITAVHDGGDLHVLGYFFDPTNPALSTFLVRQREDRRRRVLEMADRLDRLGVAVDRTAVLERAAGAEGRAIGRPMLAEALRRAGHVRSIDEAFDRWLGEGRPAYIAREGAPPRLVLELIAGAGGLSSLAHPGKLRRDELIPSLVDAGLSALEAHHPDHDAADVGRYRQMASTCRLLVTGGSDYHGPGSGRTSGLGRVTLPRDDFLRLAERAGWSGGS